MSSCGKAPPSPPSGWDHRTMSPEIGEQQISISQEGLVIFLYKINSVSKLQLAATKLFYAKPLQILRLADKNLCFTLSIP